MNTFLKIIAWVFVIAFIASCQPGQVNIFVAVNGDDINGHGSKRSPLAAALMNDQDVTTNDFYGLVEDKLNMSRGDRFHWKAEGYQLMAGNARNIL